LKNLIPLFGYASIKRKIKASYVIIIGLMLIPPLINISAFLIQTLSYDTMITNVSKASRLNLTVKTEISNELWDVIAGNKRFEQGNQYKIINSINNSLNEIKSTTSSKKNRQLLEVAGRAVDTLEQKVDLLGFQMRRNARVSENEKLLDEIRGVSALISDILTDFIVLEIESAAVTNERMKNTALIMTLFQCFVSLVVTLFAILAQRSVSSSINKPIKALELMSTRIAGGDLSARVEMPNVLELDSLTDNLNTMAVKINELIEANILEQKNKQKSEMRVLQAQITPHFLYNTLDTIIWLAEGRQYDKVIDITRAFSNFFRISLNRGRDWVSVGEEFEHVRSYLTIQKIRYRDILEYTIDFQKEMSEKPVLNLLLQPLVENALYHGIKNKRGRGHLAVKGWLEEGFLCFSVEDDGVGMTPDHLADIIGQIEGPVDAESLNRVYGLYNVNKRLELYYNRETRLQITSTHKKGTLVQFRVPEVPSRV
jgi:two-component system sensor histidine kinase YesM